MSRPWPAPHALRGSVEAMFDYRPIDTLASLPQPVLVAVAESGRPTIQTIRERRLALDDVLRAAPARGLSAPDVRFFTGAGHNLMRYRPDELAAALLDATRAAAAHQRS